jgi:hypothetical protein
MVATLPLEGVETYMLLLFELGARLGGAIREEVLKMY